MQRRLLWVLSCVLFIAGSGAADAAEVRYRFTLKDFNSEAQSALLYMFDGHQLTISEQAAGQLPMLLEVVALSATQQVALAGLAQDAWDTELEGQYTNADIADGYMMTLAVTDRAGDTRQAYISNYQVPALIALCARVNRLVAKEYQIAYAESELPLLAPSGDIIAGIDPVFFQTEINRINRGTNNIVPVLTKLRRAVQRERQDPARAQEAQQILDAVERWANVQQRAVEQSRDDDLPSAYALASVAGRMLGRDALGEPFAVFLASVRSDRAVLNGVEAELALREAKVLALSIGLGEDVEAVQWDERAQQVARRLGEKMDAIASRYQGTPAAREASETMAQWREQVRDIEARAPAWLYTWHIDLITLGTETRTRIRTDYRGNLVTDIDTDIVYDTHKVIMHGTFQNTSSQAQRYTFVAGLSRGNEETNPFISGETNVLLGFERVQTPMLQPGELYEWTAEVALRNIRHIRRGGIGRVAADQPGRRDRGRE